MKSIRLSLMVYFLALLAAALAAVSVLVYQTAHQTLLAKMAATRQLLEKQCDDQCKKETDKVDQKLLYQARAVAQLTQFQFSHQPGVGTYFRHKQPLSYASLLASYAGPTPAFPMPASVVECAHEGPIAACPAGGLARLVGMDVPKG
jgi:hypothetical protein